MSLDSDRLVGMLWAVTLDWVDERRALGISSGVSMVDGEVDVSGTEGNVGCLVSPSGEVFDAVRRSNSGKPEVAPDPNNNSAPALYRLLL